MILKELGTSTSAEGSERRRSKVPAIHNPVASGRGTSGVCIGTAQSECVTEGSSKPKRPAPNNLAPAGEPLAATMHTVQTEIRDYLQKLVQAVQQLVVVVNIIVSSNLTA